MYLALLISSCVEFLPQPYRLFTIVLRKCSPFIKSNPLAVSSGKGYKFPVGIICNGWLGLDHDKDSDPAPAVEELAYSITMVYSNPAFRLIEVLCKEFWELLFH